jgi:hypothetical protein
VAGIRVGQQEHVVGPGVARLAHQGRRDRARVSAAPGLGERGHVVQVADALQDHERPERDDRAGLVADPEPALAAGTEDDFFQAPELGDGRDVVHTEECERCLHPAPQLCARWKLPHAGIASTGGLERGADLHHDVPGERVPARSELGEQGRRPVRVERDDVHRGRADPLEGR